MAVSTKLLFFFFATIILVSSVDAKYRCRVRPKTCGLNQEYSECGNNACQNTCANPKISLVCKAACQSGCICKEGYLKNSKGECVLPKDCDCADPNAVYSECNNHPCVNTCANPGFIASCSYAQGCYPGCICKDKYLRGDDGICVPEIKCYTCNKPNELFSECNAHGCYNTCSEPDLSTRCDPPPGCNPGCICQPGYVRNNNDDCVKPEECGATTKCTGAHEMYSECGNNSCQKNCETYNQNYACRPICTPGCICEDGYIRNNLGVCVTPDQCENLVCTGKNQQYTSCVCPCCETCATLGQNVTCNFLVCNPGCDCKPGFFRNSNNECVPPEECDCKENEELDLCFNPCPPRSCDAIGKLFKCMASDPNTCKPGCKCAFNYRRDENGICIPIEKCPPLTCTGANEVFNACPYDCLDERCESLYDPLMCAAVVRECNPSCICMDGYLRNSNGVCIPATECSCLDPNEEVVSCPNPCPGGTCEAPKFADCKAPCKIRGCQCKSGYVKDSNGKCIPLSQCPGQCKENEEYKDCGPSVQPTCDNRNPITTFQCVTGCFCKENFIRHNGVCININSCPSTNVGSCHNSHPFGNDYITVRVKKCKSGGGPCTIGYYKLKHW